MVSLRGLLLESAKERAAIEFLSDLVKKSKWKGKVYLAGGMVRDELLGLEPKDIDLVIEFPQGGIKFAEWVCKKFKIYKKNSNPVIYPKFGTAKFQLYGVEYKGYDLSDLEIECVMTRKEFYSREQGRNPDVSYGNLKDDVERRDFTVNSLLKDLTSGEILDLTGQGKKDLKNGIVRTPLDPDIIFKDDPLRMLRAIRFTVKYNWKLPFFMIKALKRNSYMLKTISMERIRDELNKMLITRHPDKAIRLLTLTGLIKYVIPELEKLKGLSQNKFHKDDVLRHSIEVLKNTPNDLKIRLAGLFHDIGKSQTRSVINHEIHFYEHEKVGAEMTREIMKRLKYPNDIIDAVVIAVKNHMRTKSFGDDVKVSKRALRKLKNDLQDHLEMTLELIDADNRSHAEKYNMPHQVPKLKSLLKNLENEPSKPNLPINGNDVMKLLKIKPGPLVGKLLKAVESEWFNNPRMTKNRALKIVRDVYHDLQKN